jgi:hypothetical protein
MVVNRLKLLVCGSRSVHSYRGIVWAELDKYSRDSLIIIEGCCLHSADVWAEEKCKFDDIANIHFPAVDGNFLERDRLMVDECDMVLAFWDNVSRGTKYTVDYALKCNKPVRVVDISRGGFRG